VDLNVIPGLIASSDKLNSIGDVLTTCVLSPSLVPRVSPDDDTFVTGLPLPWKGLPGREQIASSPLGSQVLHEILVLLYSVEESLLQLHEARQIALALASPTPIPSLTNEIPLETLFASSSTSQSYRQYLQDLPLSTRTSTPKSELYLDYLTTLITHRQQPIDAAHEQQQERENPVLLTSADDTLQKASLKVLRKIFQIRQEAERILIARNQRDGGVSYFETLLGRSEQQCPSPIQEQSQSQSQSDADQVSDLIEEKAALEINYHQDPPVLYRLGQVIRHKQFGYRGVCTGYDLRPTTNTSNWDGVKGLSLGQEQPFYRV
jgi:hypothetical protein